MLLEVKALQAGKVLATRSDTSRPWGGPRVSFQSEQISLRRRRQSKIFNNVNVGGVSPSPPAKPGDSAGKLNLALDAQEFSL